MREGYSWSQLVDPFRLPEDPLALARRGSFLQGAFFDLFNQVPIGLFALSTLDGRFVRTNREFQRITGYSDDMLAGKHFGELIAPEDSERIQDYHARRVRGDPSLPKSYEMLIINRTGDRKVVLFEADVVPFRDVLIGSLLDVTAEKLVIDPLLHGHSADALASLAGGLANEFNNLIAVISGYTQLALARSQSIPAVHQPLQTILRAANRAAAQVQALLAFARTGSHALESVSLTPTLQGLVSMLPKLANAPVMVRATGFDVAGRIRGDVSKIEQALLHVLLNAVEAPTSPDVPVLISVSRREILEALSPAIPAGSYVEIAVSDSGPGIPLELQQRVFQPFFSTKDSAFHPGLGLPIALGIVRGHGGDIVIDSALGRGTRVRVLLPRDKEPSELVPALTTTLAPLIPTEILVVDDEDFVTELVRDVLEGHGMSVRTETNARRALQRLVSKDVNPKLVIVDLMMPDMDGRAFIREIRKSGFTIPILATSGYSRPHSNDMDLASEVAGFLHKPFTNEGLVAQVLSLLPALERTHE